MKKQVIAKNKVQLMTTFARPIENGQKSKKRFKKKEDFYDKAGNLIEHLEYKQGKIDKWEKFQFNTKGQLTEKIWYNCYGWDKTKFKSWSEKYSYDSNGKLITQNKSVIEKDTNGNNVETTFFLNGKIKSRTVFNSSGLCAEELEYKNEQVVKRVAFDKNGNIVSIHNFDTKGQTLNHSLFEYDDRGNQTKIKKVSRTGYVSQDRLLTYDANNNLIDDTNAPKEVYKIHNDQHLTILGPMEEEHLESYKHTYTYNEKQLLTEHKVFLAGELIMIYEHDYKLHEKQTSR